MDPQPSIQPLPAAQIPVTRSMIVSLIVLFVLFCVCLTIKGMLLGSATYVTLGSAPTLTGVVSQSMLTNTTTVPLLGGTDYKFNAVYFDNNTWAVGTLAPVNNRSYNINPGTVVLEKIDDTFRVVLGPTSAMPNTQLLSMPPDVANYVKNHVAIYTPVPD